MMIVISAVYHILEIDIKNTGVTEILIEVRDLHLPSHYLLIDLFRLVLSKIDRIARLVGMETIKLVFQEKKGILLLTDQLLLRSYHLILN